MKRARSADVTPSLILTSPYRRAMETAAVAADVFRYTGDIVQTKVLVPDGSAAQVWDEVRLYANEDAILIASHEPLMSSTCAYLLGCPALHVDMKKAALVRIDMEGFGAHPHGILRWMLTPGVCLE